MGLEGRSWACEQRGGTKRSDGNAEEESHHSPAVAAVAVVGEASPAGPTTGVELAGHLSPINPTTPPHGREYCRERRTPGGAESAGRRAWRSQASFEVCAVRRLTLCPHFSAVPFSMET